MNALSYIKTIENYQCNDALIRIAYREIILRLVSRHPKWIQSNTVHLARPNQIVNLLSAVAFIQDVSSF